MLMDRAFRTALATRSPCVVIVPHDLQKAPAPDEDEQEHGVVVTTPSWNPPHVTPHAEDLARAAEVLNAGERVALLVGQGTRDAQDLVRAVAERLGAGVTTSLLGKPWWDETLPYSCGVMGHLGTTASGRLMEHCDTLLMLGTNDPWTEYYPAPGQARAVQVDIDGRHLGNRYPVEVGLTGDTTDTLEALLPLLDQRDRAPWLDRVEGWVSQWHEIAEERARMGADPVNRAGVPLAQRTPP